MKSIERTNFNRRDFLKTVSLGTVSLTVSDCVGAANRINIAYSLSRDASTRLDIYSISGELTYRTDFVDGVPGGAFGPNIIEWDGVNLSGESVSAGVYFCYIVAADEYDTVTVSRKFLIVR